MRLNQLNSFDAAHQYIAETKVNHKALGRYKLEHNNERAHSTSALTNSLCRLIKQDQFVDANGIRKDEVLQHLETVLEDTKKINEFNNEIRFTQAQRSGPKLFLRKIFKTRTLTEDQIIEKIKKSYHKGIHNAIKDMYRKSNKPDRWKLDTGFSLITLEVDILNKIDKRNEEEPDQGIPPTLHHSHKTSSTTSHEEKSRSKSRSESEHEEIPSPTPKKNKVKFSEGTPTKEEKPVEKPRVRRPLPTPPAKRERTLRNLFKREPSAKATPPPPPPLPTDGLRDQKTSKRSQRKLKTETEKPKRPEATELEEQKKNLKKLERASTKRVLTKEEKSMRTILKDAVAAKRAHLQDSSSSESSGSTSEEFL